MKKAKASGSLRGGRRSGLGCGVEELERRDCPASLSIANVTLLEGTDASPLARFRVSLSQPSSTRVLVNWGTADGSATVADNDYQSASGTIFFSPGQISKTVTVSIRGDSKIESDELFSVRLSRAVGATIRGATGTATIRNDDVSQPVIPTLSVSDTQLPERNGGRSDARFTITLSEAITKPVTVQCSTANGTATTAGGDYVATAWRVTFAPGETEKTFSVSVLGDTRIELDETFSLVLSNPRNATIAKATGTAIIRNDDFAPPAPVVVSILGSSVIEGNGPPGVAVFAAFNITLSRVAESVVTVDYKTYDGSATTIDNDYLATIGTMTFAIGETTKMVVVPVIGDTKPERDETFSLGIVSAAGALFDRTPARATLIDDDTLPEVRVAGVALPEGNAGLSTASFVITLNRSWEQPVVVTYSTRDGSATATDSDYLPALGTVTFAPGEYEKTVGVSVIGDTRAEIDERFFIDLSSAINATIAEGTGTVIIQNDDSGEVPGFQITVDYSGTVRQSIKDACDWAAQRWSQVITGDLPGVWDAQRGVFVDDLRITVQEGLLGGGDGPGGALANAGPDAFRAGATGLPWAASAGIDPFDASDSQLRNIVLHEFGHALGFGIAGGGSPIFYSQHVFGDGFVGTNALREYRSLFGNAAASVPLETGGGAGTVGAHWRESVFTTELMTGYSEARGVAMPLSRITVGAMQDMGYSVNYAAADAFAASGRSSTNGQQSRALGGASPPVQSARKAATLLNGSTIERRRLSLEATRQPILAYLAPLMESPQRSSASTPKDRIFSGFAARVAGATAEPLSTLAWRALRPA